MICCVIPSILAPHQYLLVVSPLVYQPGACIGAVNMAYRRRQRFVQFRIYMVQQYCKSTVEHLQAKR